jgi:L-ribulose-5-phosphate 4-epimerase
MLQDLKERVCRANIELQSAGLVALTFGNASGISRADGLVAIKPSGVAYEDLRPDDIVVLDLDGKRVEGALNPSSDTPTHLALYRGFPDIGGITHTHCAFATMFAQACREIPCFGTTHADHFHGPVPVARALSEAEVREGYEVNTGRVILERFAGLSPAEVPAVLCAHHGPFTWGKDVEDAVKNAIALEVVAKAALGALLLRPDLPPIPPHILDKHYTRKHGPAAYYGQRAAAAKKSVRGTMGA